MLKGHTTKVTSQEEGFPNFLKRLMTAGSPLMKSVPTPLAKINKNIIKTNLNLTVLIYEIVNL